MPQVKRRNPMKCACKCRGVPCECEFIYVANPVCEIQWNCPDVERVDLILPEAEAKDDLGKTGNYKAKVDTLYRFRVTCPDNSTFTKDVDTTGETPCCDPFPPCGTCTCIDENNTATSLASRFQALLDVSGITSDGSLTCPGGDCSGFNGSWVLGPKDPTDFNCGYELYDVSCTPPGEVGLQFTSSISVEAGSISFYPGEWLLTMTLYNFYSPIQGINYYQQAWAFFEWPYEKKSFTDPACPGNTESCWDCTDIRDFTAPLKYLRCWSDTRQGSLAESIECSSVVPWDNLCQFQNMNASLSIVLV